MAKYFDVHPDNPQPRTIGSVGDSIRNGALVAYPTDSCYALGTRLGSRDGISRIRAIRDLDDRHHFTLMCQNFAQLGQLVHIDNDVFRAVKNATPGAYTFILPATKEVPRRLMNEKKKTIGIRVPANNIALALLETLGEPLLSTTLILPGSEMAEFDPEEIADKLGKQLDLVVNGGYLGEQPTTVVDFSDDEPVLRRRGAGDPTPFE